MNERSKKSKFDTSDIRSQKRTSNEIYNSEQLMFEINLTLQRARENYPVIGQLYKLKKTCEFRPEFVEISYVRIKDIINDIVLTEKLGIEKKTNKCNNKTMYNTSFQIYQFTLPGTNHELEITLMEA